MRPIPRTFKAVAVAQTDPDPRFISLVKVGANQTPFRALKSAVKDELAMIVLKGEGASVVGFAFPAASFTTATVKAFMDDGGYSDYAIIAGADYIRVKAADAVGGNDQPGEAPAGSREIALSGGVVVTVITNKAPNPDIAGNTPSMITSATPVRTKEDEPAERVKRDFTAVERATDASSGAAMPDGSFPIENGSDLENAVRALGRAKNPAAAKRHIILRARSLGLTAKLPEDWKVSKKDEEQAAAAKAAGNKLRNKPADADTEAAEMGVPNSGGEAGAVTQSSSDNPEDGTGEGLPSGASAPHPATTGNDGTGEGIGTRGGPSVIATPGSTGPQDATGAAIPSRGAPSKIGKKFDDWSERMAKPTAFSDALESKADGAHPDLHGLTRSLHDVTKACVAKGDYEGVKKAAGEYADLVTKMGQVFDGARSAKRAKSDLDAFQSKVFNDQSNDTIVVLKAVSDLSAKLDTALQLVSSQKADTDAKIQEVKAAAEAVNVIVQRGAQAGDEAVSAKKEDAPASASDFVRDLRIRSQFGQPPATLSRKK